MYYSIRHVTRFAYDAPIWESVMEARMQPRTDATQRCHHFGLSTTPSSRVLMERLFQGELGSPFEGLRPGQLALDFTLDKFEGPGKITLSKLLGDNTRCRWYRAMPRGSAFARQHSTSSGAATS